MSTIVSSFMLLGASAFVFFFLGAWLGKNKVISIIHLVTGLALLIAFLALPFPVLIKIVALIVYVLIFAFPFLKKIKKFFKTVTAQYIKAVAEAKEMEEKEAKEMEEKRAEEKAKAEAEAKEKKEAEAKAKAEAEAKLRDSIIANCNGIDPQTDEKFINDAVKSGKKLAEIIGEWIIQTNGTN